MKTAENATHQVRIAMREMRNASRDELRQRLPHLTAEQVSNGVDNLASQKHVKAATKTRHKMTDGRTKMVWIYRYIGPEFDQPRKPPRHVKSPETLHRAQPMSAIAARTKKHVAQATSGLAGIAGCCAKAGAASATARPRQINPRICISGERCRQSYITKPGTGKAAMLSPWRGPLQLCVTRESIPAQSVREIRCRA